MKMQLLFGMSLFILCPVYGSAAVKTKKTGAFELIRNENGILIYKNKDKSLRAIKRPQNPPLKGPIPFKDLRKIATVRLRALEALGLGHHSFKIAHIYKEPVRLSARRVGYAYRGSYKDPRGKTHFFKEYISQGETWNVFADKESDLQQANQIIRSLIQ